MRRKKDESPSAFEVAIESDEFQLPEDLAPRRLSLKEIIRLYVNLWGRFTQVGGRDATWLVLLCGLNFDISRTAEVLGISESALRQRLSRLRKALKIAQKRKPRYPALKGGAF